MPKDLEQASRAAGILLRRRRLIVVRVLAGAIDHPTAEDIHQRARAHDAKISQATIYRTLSILLQHKLIYARDFGDGKTRYEDASHGPHDHIIDAATGAIQNCKDPELEQALRDFMLQRGYALKTYRLDLVCSPARNQKHDKIAARSS
ncbi:MAG TPA: transcriptional repressor [Verrucomicrobiae bacterium]|jgi:Fur family ferric uptake transcriptional regulator|nr:transcriptional repressor [Verrucomicrobiae bacterium]